MKRKRHSPEEIIKKLREAGVMLAEGKSVEEVSRVLGVSTATYQRWKSEYGGVKKDALKRLKELKKESGSEGIVRCAKPQAAVGGLVIELACGARMRVADREAAGLAAQVLRVIGRDVGC